MRDKKEVKNYVRKKGGRKEREGGKEEKRVEEGVENERTREFDWRGERRIKRSEGDGKNERGGHKVG